MTKLLSLALSLSLCAFSSLALADKTVVNDPGAKARLLGDHKLALQWVSWDYFGKARVTDNDGTLTLKGEQKSRENSDLLSVDGVITAIDTKEFKFHGTIVTQVSHINGGQACTREGDFTFKITGTRKYWRLQEMDNPCDGVTDYVDVFFGEV